LVIGRVEGEYSAFTVFNHGLHGCFTEENEEAECLGSSARGQRELREKFWFGMVRFTSVWFGMAWMTMPGPVLVNPVDRFGPWFFEVQITADRCR
jgi:hypothetical protein